MEFDVVKPLQKFTNVISNDIRGESRTAATSRNKHFVIVVNDWKPLTIITKRSILDVAVVLDPPLDIYCKRIKNQPDKLLEKINNYHPNIKMPK